MSATPTFLKPGDVAARFGISVTQVSRLSNAGKIPFHRTPGGHRRFRSDEIDQLERDLADGASF